MEGMCKRTNDYNEEQLINIQKRTRTSKINNTKIMITLIETKQTSNLNDLYNALSYIKPN